MTATAEATDVTRAAVYLRISRDHSGEQLAVRRQREDCLAIAEQRGWTVVGEYVDNGVSAAARTARRPEYDRMVRDYDAGAFDALVCWDLDRLTRQPRQLEDWIDAATGRGLRLVTANGEADLGNDAGRLFARVKAAVARSEIERKGARQKRASRQRAEQGKPPSGRAPMGYDTSGRIIPEQAAVVAAMFDKVAAGESIAGVLRWLEDVDVPPPRGKRWYSSTVRAILLNPRYAGLTTYCGERLSVPGEWSPIVTEDRYAVVRARLTDPRRVSNRVGTHRKHLGSGLWRCAQCDTSVTSAQNGSYQCPSCRMSRVRPAVDEYVTETVAQRLARPDAEALLTKRDHSDPAAAQLVSQLRDRLAAVEADYDAGLIDGRRYAAAHGKVSAELDRAEAALLAVGQDAALAGLLSGDHRAESFRSASLSQQRAIIDALCVVRLVRVPRGRRGFDPATVVVEWRSS